MSGKYKVISILLTVANCVLLFLPWGTAKAGGEVKLAKTYSNPILVEGSYPRGVAAAVKRFSDELDGFQEQCELVEMILMMILIFLAVMEILYGISLLASFEMSHALGIVAGCLTAAVALAGIMAGLVWRNGTIDINAHFRIVTVIRLNVVPFLIILIEILGKCVIPRTDKKHCTDKKID